MFTNICNVYNMCTGVNKKEVKLIEAVLLGSLHTLLTKEKGFRLQGTIKCGDVTRKYMGELMKDNVYVHKVCLCKLILVTSCPQ